jgi:hypothetical protein
MLPMRKITRLGFCRLIKAAKCTRST